jgi:hypothetical protein
MKMFKDVARLLLPCCRRPRGTEDPTIWFVVTPHYQATVYLRPNGDTNRIKSQYFKITTAEDHILCDQAAVMMQSWQL